MKIIFVFLLSSILIVPVAESKVKYKEKQEVNLDGESVDGVVRNPYGSYLAQKRGVQFMPLYKVRESFDENIKQSVEYLK